MDVLGGYYRECMRSQAVAILLGNLGTPFLGYSNKNYLGVPQRDTMEQSEMQEIERRTGIVVQSNFLIFWIWFLYDFIERFISWQERQE